MPQRFEFFLTNSPKCKIGNFQRKHDPKDRQKATVLENRNSLERLHEVPVKPSINFDGID